MRKGVLFLICFCLAFCFFAQSLGAQNRFSYALESVAGLGIEKGPQYTVTEEFVTEYSLKGGFLIGVGAGLRYAAPCYQYIIKNGVHTKSRFANELDAPLFARVGYTGNRMFLKLDAGYSIGLYGHYQSGVKPGGKKAPSYYGLFFEPHIGVKFGKRSALALGVLLQKSTVSAHVITETGTMGDPSWSSTGEVSTQRVLTPAITLRYCVSF